MTLPPTRRLAAAFARALGDLDVKGAVAHGLAGVGLPSDVARVRLVALGKAAPAMALGAIEALGPRLERGLVVCPDGTPVTLADARVTLLRAAHPLPDDRSVAAADAALAIARDGDALVVLVSGGASALACAPSAGVTLATKRALTEELLASGAPIAAINVVRRHLSHIKGGRLAAAAAPRFVATLLVSDVLGGALEDIGSGPTVPDPSSVADARAILARYAPRFVDLPLVESCKPGDPALAASRARVVLSPQHAAEAMANALLPLRVTILPPSTADVASLADAYVAHASTIAPGEALVRAAEPSVVVPARVAGRGGRASHLAALVAPRLPPGVAFLAGATDGADGRSDAAGAAVDAASFSRAAADAAIARFDTAALHAAAGTAIALGPTGVNFADLHVLART